MTTVLHGIAAGNPTFSAVNRAADVRGNLPLNKLNAGTNALATTFGVVMAVGLHRPLVLRTLYLYHFAWQYHTVTDITKTYFALECNG